MILWHNDIHILETTCYEKNSVCISIKFPYNKSVPIHVHDTNATGIKGGRLQWNDEKGFFKFCHLDDITNIHPSQILKYF